MAVSRPKAEVAGKPDWQKSGICHLSRFRPKPPFGPYAITVPKTGGFAMRRLLAVISIFFVVGMLAVAPGRAEAQIAKDEAAMSPWA